MANLNISSIKLIQSLLIYVVFYTHSTFCLADTPDDTEAGALFLTAESETRQAISLSTKASFDIEGMTAKVKVIQEFSNDGDLWAEGIYVFPLPENSAVNYLAMHIGERVIEAEIKEKQEAKKIYEKAKAEGKKAAITIQRRPNLFTQKVANIPPGEKIKVELRYLQNVRYDMGQFSLRFPMTITPRFNPGTALQNLDDEQVIQSNSMGWSVPTFEVPDADKISPFYHEQSLAGNPIEILVKINAGLPLASIDSVSHSITNQQTSSIEAHIELRGGNELMDRDFELRWQPVKDQAPQAAIFHEHMNNSSYIQLMMLPPQLTNIQNLFARELTLIIDTSGSMQGQSIEQAKASAVLALKQLKNSDSFNIIEFNSDFRKFSARPVSAEALTINQAINWVNQLEANGGTNMSPALYAALTSQESEKLKQIVFVTDGAVGNEHALFKLIYDKLGQARLFTVGIGSAPNSFFMRKAAEFGRGTFTHIGDINQVKNRMAKLFQKLESAVISDIDIQWPDGTETKYFPQRIPDLYLGEPLLISAKIDNALINPEAINISGTIAGNRWNREILIPLEKNVFNTNVNNERSAIASRWARENIEHLLDLRVSGEKEENIKPKVLALALEHQLMSPYTSFVAVEKEISRPEYEKLQKQAIPNSPPKGQNVQQFMMPKTATSGYLHILLGAIFLSVLAIFRSIEHRFKFAQG